MLVYNLLSESPEARPKAEAWPVGLKKKSVDFASLGTEVEMLRHVN